VALFSETHLKPHERLYIPKYFLYRIDRHPERKDRMAIAVRKGIPYIQVDLPPLVSIEATPISNCKVLHAAVYKSPSCTWCDTGITEILGFGNKCFLAGDLNDKQPFWNSAFQPPQEKNSCNCSM
jgi:hypothetical protein